MYLAVFAKNIKQQMMYRSEFLLSIVGNMLYIYIQICIWRALLGSGSGMASSVTASGMVTYVIVAYLIQQASRTYFTATFAQKVNQGDIAIDLIRPVSMKNLLIAEQISENVCKIVFSCVPVAVIAGFVWGVEAPIPPAQMLAFCLSVLLAVALSFYMDYIAGLTVFWTRSQVYSRQIFGGLKTIFSGSTIPLWFYPGWLAGIGAFLPFRLMAFEPVRIFMGRVDMAGSLYILFQQMAWLLLLYGIERLIWFKLQSNVFVQGG